MYRTAHPARTCLRPHFISLLTLLTCVALSPDAVAQIPGALTGASVVSKVSDGKYPFAAKGYFIFVPADTALTYQLFGFGGVVDSQGPYSYFVSNSTTAVLTLQDTVVGSIVDETTYLSPSGGVYHSTVPDLPGVSQDGSFEVFNGEAPVAGTGFAFLARADDGKYPFGRGGVFSFVRSPQSSTYSVTGSGLNGWYTSGSTGTCSYALLNRSTAKLQLEDAVSGPAAVYLAFTNTLGGWYGVRGSGGFQVGRFYSLGFLKQPADRIVQSGTTATFEAQAGGAGPLGYQWLLNGVSIPGANQPSYTTDTLTLSDTGKRFSCIVSNPYASVLSREATLHVTVNRVVTLQGITLWTNTSLFVTNGQRVTLRAAGRWIWSGATIAEFGPDGDALDDDDASDLFSSQALHGALIAYVGSDPYQGHWGDTNFFPRADEYWTIGSSNQFTSSKAGELWLGFNDDATSMGIGDNEGSLSVELVGIPPTASISLRLEQMTSANVRLRASGGAPGSAFRVLGSPELSVPKSSWAVITSGSFGLNGTAQTTVPRSQNTQQMFYLLASP